jgi:hypothetical protein
MTTRISTPAPLLTISRVGAVILLVLAIANGAFLYLVPSRAATDYAWSINPPTTAAFMGAGYIAGAVATALVAFRVTVWRSLRVMPWPLGVLSVAMIAATLIHEDRFRWGYVPTWMWVVVYVLAPLGIAYVWREQERLSPVPPVAHPALRRIRDVTWVTGVIVLGTGVVLFVAPTVGVDHWPWTLTELTARVLGGWYGLIGASQLLSAATVRRPHEVLVPYAALLVWTSLLLLLPLLYWDDMTRTGIEFALWFGLHAVLLVLAVWALAVAVPLSRAEGERL